MIIRTIASQDFSDIKTFADSNLSESDKLIYASCQKYFPARGSSTMGCMRHSNEYFFWVMFMAD